MTNTKYAFLPQEILSTGFNLESLEISEMAWKSQTAIAVIDFLFSKGYTILGGDVYVYKNDSVEITYDSWYLNETVSKNFLQESKNKAIEYINKYSTLNGENYIYSIIF